MTQGRVSRPGRAPATDGDLFRTVAGGDLGALGTLFDRHHERVRAFLSRAAPAADVDDLVQDTFLTAVRAADSYDGRDDARPFLVGVAAQLVFRRRRSFARLRAMLARVGEASSHATPPTPPTPEDLATRRAESEAVRSAVAKLSDERRLALLLVEWEGLGGEEAARSLGIPVGTLYRRLHEARAEVGRVLRRAEARAGSCRPTTDGRDG
jgi:RNA polymerase sigma-70 factor (ECF subfamily)